MGLYTCSIPQEMKTIKNTIFLSNKELYCAIIDAFQLWLARKNGEIGNQWLKIVIGQWAADKEKHIWLMVLQVFK